MQGFLPLMLRCVIFAKTAAMLLSVTTSRTENTAFLAHLEVAAGGHENVEGRREDDYFLLPRGPRFSHMNQPYPVNKSCVTHL